jgi:adenosine kinase
MQVTDGEKLLKKYDLKPDDGILAQDKHASIYDEIVKDYKVTYVAGGAAQNTGRGAAYILPPGSVVFAGCVGDDDLAEQLKVANKREGLIDAYLVRPGEKTGVCAVVITGQYRSLVTSLRAAKQFHQSHLFSPAIAQMIDAAQVFYIEGYMLSHGFACVEQLCKKVTLASKLVAFNLSAPRIPQQHSAELQDIIHYCDVLIGNKAEAEAWASVVGLPDKKDLNAIAKTLAILPKSNPSRPRIVILTQGPHPTVLVSSAEPDSPKLFPVHPLLPDQIVDTNGAGDAFAGGFLGALILGKNIEESIEAGHRLGAMCVQLVGPQYLWPKIQIL